MEFLPFPFFIAVAKNEHRVARLCEMSQFGPNAYAKVSYVIPAAIAVTTLVPISTYYSVAADVISAACRKLRLTHHLEVSEANVVLAYRVYDGVSIEFHSIDDDQLLGRLPFVMRHLSAVAAAIPSPASSSSSRGAGGDPTAAALTPAAAAEAVQFVLLPKRFDGAVSHRRPTVTDAGAPTVDGGSTPVAAGDTGPPGKGGRTTSNQVIVEADSEEDDSSGNPHTSTADAIWVAPRSGNPYASRPPPSPPGAVVAAPGIQDSRADLTPAPVAQRLASLERTLALTQRQLQVMDSQYIDGRKVTVAANRGPPQSIETQTEPLMLSPDREPKQGTLGDRVAAALGDYLLTSGVRPRPLSSADNETVSSPLRDTAAVHRSLGSGAAQQQTPSTSSATKTLLASPGIRWAGTPKAESASPSRNRTDAATVPQRSTPSFVLSSGAPAARSLPNDPLLATLDSLTLERSPSPEVGMRPSQSSRLGPPPSPRAPSVSSRVVLVHPLLGATMADLSPKSLLSIL